MAKLTQSQRILVALLEGPIDSAWFMDTYPRIKQSTARVSELRKELRKLGGDLVSRRLTESNWEYELAKPYPEWNGRGILPENEPSYGVTAQEGAEGLMEVAETMRLFDIPEQPKPRRFV